jgi:acetoin:2,6-dichlorophenolindophenol oxidoreductase subunit alpha
MTTRTTSKKAVPERQAGQASVDNDRLLRMYRQMLRIRAFDQHANELYLSAKMPGLTHMYIGQEAVAVGVCEALQQDDYITSTHRGHGHCVAKGAKLDLMFAELLGKEAGYCRGKGGSMHIADQEHGNLGANAIVGGSAGIATGAAFSAKSLGNGKVAVCFFGEGALGQGLIYEVMNMASLWQLPVVYVCENNLYSEYTHYTETTAGRILARAEAFDILSQEVNGQDVRAVYQAARTMIDRARAGDGPAFLLCHTYRYHGHHVGDVSRDYYRPKAEEQEWKTNRDPIAILRAWLLDQGLVPEAQLVSISQEVDQETEQAVQFGLNAPYPNPNQVSEDVYV